MRSIQSLLLPVFTAALFTIAKTWRQPKCPSTNECIKRWCIYTVEYYSAIKKNELMPFASTWMDLEIIILSEDTNELSYKTEIDPQTENKLLVTKGKTWCKERKKDVLENDPNRNCSISPQFLKLPLTVLLCLALKYFEVDIRILFFLNKKKLGLTEKHCLSKPGHAMITIP
ncbi:hypothetical protein FD755_024259 [Muntiacus reevesi]|uniref:Uncharacterized protein n=1 Tax=Muntiacus reevesi TaxID=9886 RepID=A0A5N3VCR2_MUNRE|nr:hypothetical protein FD755_024259 [Muntiacus reevesi]